jgi:NADH:ubiquinone oxidoreductase subunit H
LCLKVGILFLLLILVRITVPRLRVETLSRLGWVSGLSLFSYILVAYGVVWFVL